MKLQDVFPECYLYREQYPRIEPIVCLKEDMACCIGKGCMETLCRRVNAIFGEVVPGTQILVLYFKSNTTGKLGAGIFWKDGREPRVITMNKYAWERVKKRSHMYQFTPSLDFFLTGTSSDIKESNEIGNL